MVPWGKNKGEESVTWSHPERLNRDGEVKERAEPARSSGASREKSTRWGPREWSPFSAIFNGEVYAWASLQWQGNYNTDVVRVLI